MNQTIKFLAFFWLLLLFLMHSCNGEPAYDTSNLNAKVYYTPNEIVVINFDPDDYQSNIEDNPYVILTINDKYTCKVKEIKTNGYDILAALAALKGSEEDKKYKEIEKNPPITYHFKLTEFTTYDGTRFDYSKTKMLRFSIEYWKKVFPKLSGFEREPVYIHPSEIRLTKFYYEKTWD